MGLSVSRMITMITKVPFIGPLSFSGPGISTHGCRQPCVVRYHSYPTLWILKADITKSQKEDKSSRSHSYAHMGQSQDVNPWLHFWSPCFVALGEGHTELKRNSKPRFPLIGGETSTGGAWILRSTERVVSPLGPSHPGS